MYFNSLQYALFLPVVLLVFRLTGDRVRCLWLLLASVAFYAALGAPHLLAVLAVVTVSAYAVGLWLSERSEERSRRLIFYGGVIFELAVFASLKYLPLLAQKWRFLSAGLHVPTILVTVGVSYFVFQAISYLADIYLGIAQAERRFARFALYMAFFPKLLQGPIERAGELLPQFDKPYAFDYDDARAGLVLFAWGLFQKIVVAEGLAPMVDAVYGNVRSYAGLPLIVATYLYAFQIFFDFSGYTDMALGTARLFGIKLTRNFDNPYLAVSIAQFWRRWHISFSRWILDYIFKPLSVHWRGWKTKGTALALLVTFVASGLWHGAAKRFVAWGLLHGIYLAASLYYRPLQGKIYRLTRLEGTWIQQCWQRFVTFNLVAFAWIFFRADSNADALYVAKNLFATASPRSVGVPAWYDMFSPKTSGPVQSSFAFVAACTLAAIVLSHLPNKERIFGRPVWARWTFYYLLTAAILLLGRYDDSTKFIYLRF